MDRGSRVEVRKQLTPICLSFARCESLVKKKGKRQCTHFICTEAYSQSDGNRAQWNDKLPTHTRIYSCNCQERILLRESWTLFTGERRFVYFVQVTSCAHDVTQEFDLWTSPLLLRIYYDDSCIGAHAAAAASKYIADLCLVFFSTKKKYAFSND